MCWEKLEKHKSANFCYYPKDFNYNIFVNGVLILLLMTLAYQYKTKLT